MRENYGSNTLKHSVDVFFDRINQIIRYFCPAFIYIIVLYALSESTIRGEIKNFFKYQDMHIIIKLSFLFFCGTILYYFNRLFIHYCSRFAIFINTKPLFRLFVIIITFFIILILINICVSKNILINSSDLYKDHNYIRDVFYWLVPFSLPIIILLCYIQNSEKSSLTICITDKYILSLDKTIPLSGIDTLRWKCRHEDNKYLNSLIKEIDNWSTGMHVLYNCTFSFIIIPTFLFFTKTKNDYHEFHSLTLFFIFLIITINNECRLIKRMEWIQKEYNKEHLKIMFR